MSGVKKKKKSHLFGSVPHDPSARCVEAPGLNTGSWDAARSTPEGYGHVRAAGKAALLLNRDKIASEIAPWFLPAARQQAVPPARSSVEMHNWALLFNVPPKSDKGIGQRTAATLTFPP